MGDVLDVRHERRQLFGRGFGRMNSARIMSRNGAIANQTKVFSGRACDKWPQSGKGAPGCAARLFARGMTTSSIP
jgi:hypothetical protein